MKSLNFCYIRFKSLKIFNYLVNIKMKEKISMVEHVKLKISANDDYEWLIDEDTNEILAEGHKLAAEDVLYALGYRFSIEIDPFDN